MTESTRSAAPTIVPTLRYRDAAAAILWLEDAFGFERMTVVADQDGTIAHAELRFGVGVVMLGQLRDESGPPVDRQGIYVVVPDSDAHHALARAAGAEILAAPFDTDYGSREYTARDPDGHSWSFGTYAPDVT